MDSEGGTVALTLTNGEGCGCVLSGMRIRSITCLGRPTSIPVVSSSPAGIAMSTMMALTLAHRGREMVLWEVVGLTGCEMRCDDPHQHLSMEDT